MDCPPTIKAYWASDVNSQELFNNFSDELKKADPSSGDFKADYLSVCDRLGVIPCSFFVYDPVLSACKISNCQVDISSWRAAMVACGLTGSPVKCFVVHHCSLQRQHILDLVAMLEKREFFDAIKLDNIDWGDQTAEADSLFTSLFSCAAVVEYVSLRHNGLSDTFVSSNAAALAHNIGLKYLNLSNNLITNEGFQCLISKVLRLSLSLYKVSLKSNLIDATALDPLLDLIFGNVCTPEEDSAFKAISKAATDKNKHIKDINKKKKKNNEPEINELIVPERIKKIGKTDLQLINKTICGIDLSWGVLLREGLDTFSELIAPRKEESPDTQFHIVPLTELGNSDYKEGFSLIY